MSKFYTQDYCDRFARWIQLRLLLREAGCLLHSSRFFHLSDGAWEAAVLTLKGMLTGFLPGLYKLLESLCLISLYLCTVGEHMLMHMRSVFQAPCF